MYIAELSEVKMIVVWLPWESLVTIEPATFHIREVLYIHMYMQVHG